MSSKANVKLDSLMKATYSDLKSRDRNITWSLICAAGLVALKTKMLRVENPGTNTMALLSGKAIRAIGEGKAA